jgi:serine/threonine protein kinase/WD40 repeat protein
MPESGKCPICGAELSDSPDGQCVQCLLRLGLGHLEEGKGFTGEDSAEVNGTEKIGEKIGPYKLLQQIGEGGCGIVYMAEQENPVRRRVALKVIKLGMDTKQVIARFEAERQALALMDHPNIAKVFDAGATKTGRPYFVMELVRGVKITEYSDGNKLDTNARLELFLQVCRAIHHAHQKGIIHRDIKPSNILVALHENAPVPKVIDFGIAKATTDQRLTDKTLFTAFEQFVGTPAYMSPEQAQVTSLDVDTRSDIYSLGVLLYELLTGKTPFETRELLQSGLDELRHIILEKEPARPSTRLTMLGEDELRRIAKERKLEPPKLIGLIRGDLDWIAMKTLEKDRTRRYETANGLAMDIRRHLNNEPVLARPPSKLYRFQKLVRRNKLTFAAGFVVLTSLVAGIIVSRLDAERATLAESAEKENRVRADEEARKARFAEADAKEQLLSSYLAQAQAWRWSHRAGRRFNSLEILKKAAETRPSLELRNEAIACMTLPDLRLGKEWNREMGSMGWLSFDRNCERYAIPDEQGNISVRAIDNGRELAFLRGFGVGPTFVSFSPKNQWLAAGYNVPNKAPCYVWDLAQREVVLKPLVTNVRTIEFSPDGNHVAIAAFDGPITFCDLPSGSVLQSFPQEPLVWRLAFHPQGRMLAVGSAEDRVVKVWDVETRVLRSFPHPNGVLSLAWNPEGSLLAVGCNDSRIYLWDVSKGKSEATTLIGHQSAVANVLFDRSGSRLASAGWDGYLRLWDTITANEICNRTVPSHYFAFGSDDRTLICTTGQNKLGVLDLAGSNECKLLGFDEMAASEPWRCVFSPDGLVLVSAHRGGLRFWEVRTGAEIAFQPIGDTRCVAFERSGKSLITNGADGLRRWPIEMSLRDQVNKLRIGPPTHIGWYDGLDGFSLDNEKRFILTIREGKACLVNLQTRVEKCFKSDASFGFCALSGDARRCVAGDYRMNKVCVFDIETSALIKEISVTEASTVSFSPDNQWLLVGGYKEYSSWNTTSWEKSWNLERENLGRMSAKISFTPDSRIVAILLKDRLIHLVDPATGHQFATLESREPSNISALAFHPTGTKLAACGWNHMIQLWDLRLIRDQLAAINLDWELPAYSPQGDKSEK